MSKSQLDQFIDDDEEETCPLCVEEFDLSDKGFRPCPCGYQICQFCYHSIKTNMNGLCPACRREYDDKNIEIKTITPEEMAAHKARQAQKQKKTQAALQKEKQKAEADNLSRKHLAGLRVVQKNLVYVTGLQPTTHEDQLLQTLRGQDYFGQYGKIIKIVVSKAKDTAHPNSVGVYVTFERKEDAEKCIAAVNGSRNQDRTLRAQFGTTKYCSAYLRGENCTNRNCMFLHEPGEANESYSRADLSALNAGSSQHGIGRPPPQSQQPVASASQPMARQSSSDQASSPPPDRPALPSTASWASRVPPGQPTRPESRSTSATIESPAPVHATPAASQSDQSPRQEQPVPVQEEADSDAIAEPVPKPQPVPRRREASLLVGLVKNFKPDDLKVSISIESLPQGVRDIIRSYPPLFDLNGGAKRKLRRQREEEQRRMEQEAEAFRQPPALEADENLELGGSLQLGGEPEDRQSMSQPQSAIQPPGTDGLDSRFHFGGLTSPGVSDRGISPQQHQQLLLQSMKSNMQSSYLNNVNQQNAFQTNNAPGHQRNTSRFSFANESSASTNVKPVANPKLMNQQSAMMPSMSTGNHFGVSSSHQAQHSGNNQFYTSNVQGPPPGIKMTGTPPVSGGMTFGQGHGFATGGLQYGANTGLNANEERMRSLLRGRDAGEGTTAKQDVDFPPLAASSHQQRISIDETRRPTPPFPPGLPLDTTDEPRRSTPTIPPGISKPPAVPGERPTSRASLKRTTSQITPVVPLRPATPAKPATPTSVPKTEREIKEDHVETPTKAPKAVAVQEKAPKPVEANVAVSEDTASQTAVSDTKVEVVKDGSAQASDSTTNKTAGKQGTMPVATAKAVQDSAPRGMQPASKGQATVQTSEAQATPETPTKDKPTQESGKKRTPPGKLDIAAAVSKQPIKSSSSASTDTSIPSVAQRSVSQTPAEAAKPESPAGNLASPAAKSTPKTLRVVQTPKAETLSAATSSTVKDPGLPGAKQPSRQPSVASIQIPGTPSSEQVSMSDYVSIPSTSQSRANSPPPPESSKVGSAPIKAKTKAQLKKERQERAKLLEEEKQTEEPKAISIEEPAQEAIVSRKKKTKKEKEPKPKAKAPLLPPTGDSTPTASRAPSPPPKPVDEVPIEPEAVVHEQPVTPTKTPTVKESPIQSPRAPSPPSTPTLTAAELLAELRATVDPTTQKSIESLFRSPNSTHFKPSHPIEYQDRLRPALFRMPHEDFRKNLKKDEIDALLAGTAPFIRYEPIEPNGEGRMWNRGIITPGGAHIRALTEELENRFMELEELIREQPTDLRFRPTKPQNDMKFPSVDLEAMRRALENGGARGVSVMEQMVQDGSNMKKGAFLVDEASKYINEFIMPPAEAPPSAAAGAARGPALANAPAPNYEPPVPSVDIAERQLNEARRVVDERDSALKKIMKKNKKIFGLG